jgi:hypothetical protein
MTTDDAGERWPYETYADEIAAYKDPYDRIRALERDKAALQRTVDDAAGNLTAALEWERSQRERAERAEAEVVALQREVEGLSEALSWALDTLAINDTLIAKRLPDEWKQLNRAADLTAKVKARRALARATALSEGGE